MGRTRAAENKRDPGRDARAKLSPGVECRGPGQYRAALMIDGRRMRSETFETNKEAADWITATKGKAQEGKLVDLTSLKRWTVGSIVQRFSNEALQDGGERRGAAEDRIGHIPAILGDKVLATINLWDLTRFDVQAFRDRQLAIHAKSTTVKRLNLLQQAFDLAINAWAIPMQANLAASKAVPRPKGADIKRERRLIVPSDDEIKGAVERGEDPPIKEETLLLAALENSPWPHDVQITKWGLAQGMRQGEAFALEWGDLNIKTRIVEVWGRHRLGTKNKRIATRSEMIRAGIKPERRPLMPETIAILLEIKGDRKVAAGERVFNCGPQTAFKVRFGRMLARAQTDASDMLKAITYHDLRHEATSRLAKIFTNRDDLMRVTGHKDLKSLDRYYHPDLSELAQVAALADVARKAAEAALS